MVEIKNKITEKVEIITDDTWQLMKEKNLSNRFDKIREFQPTRIINIPDEVIEKKIKIKKNLNEELNENL